jgi:glucokinase
MDHDVNSAAWAEYRLGVSAGSSIALLVALGTGIGAGLLVDGQIYRGAHGVAPELGHLTVVPGGRPCPCGKQGCWERYCSGTALAQTARLQMADHDAPVLRRLSGDDPAAVTGTMVAVAATEGDPVALGAMDELGHWLAAGLALVTDVLDPEMIVIGGGVSAAAGMFLPLAVSEFGRSITGAGHRPLPRVELARFGDRAGIIGAALLAAEAAGTA